MNDLERFYEAIKQGTIDGLTKSKYPIAKTEEVELLAESAARQTVTELLYKSAYDYLVWEAYNVPLNQRILPKKLFKK